MESGRVRKGSRSVLYLFLGSCFRPDDPVMTQKLPSFEISKLSCKMPGLLDQKLGHLLGDESGVNDPVKSDGYLRAAEITGSSGLWFVY
jgi:hypothetical protein